MANISNIFNYGRFAATLRKEWGENRRQLLLLIVLAVGMMAVAAAFVTSVSYNSTTYFYDTFGNNSHQDASSLWNRQYVSYNQTLYGFLCFILVSFITIAASLAFARTASKEGMLQELMNPASQFEKFLSKFIIFGIGAWIAAIAAWFITVFGLYFVMDWFTPYGEFYFPITPGRILNNQWTFFATLGQFTVFAAIFLQSFFFLGSTVWPRSSFFKTFGAASAITFCMFLMVVLSVHTFQDMIQPGSDENIPMFFKRPCTRHAIVILLSCLNYAIAFMRCRENEVIRRW